MGEYARYRGEEIKIGTCENMYYLRADHAHLVEALHGNVDPVKDAGEIRFRFPFPEEDELEPGQFDDAFRKHTVRGFGVPAEWEFEHYSVQFRADAGYLVSLPCPEGPNGDSPEYRIARNGFQGAVHIVQQRLWEGRMVTVCECGGCRAKFRLETLEMAEPVIVALRSEADEQNRVALRNDTPGNAAVADRIHQLADRITAGYVEGPPPAIARGSRFPTPI